jgi:hypothetical protein
MSVQRLLVLVAVCAASGCDLPTHGSSKPSGAAGASGAADASGAYVWECRDIPLPTGGCPYEGEIASEQTCILQGGQNFYGGTLYEICCSGSWHHVSNADGAACDGSAATEDSSPDTTEGPPSPDAGGDALDAFAAEASTDG